jgi:hypothetical protein
MWQRTSLLLALSLLVAPGVVAQGSTLVLSQNKCAPDKQGQIRQLTDSLWIPVAQELVNEGKIISAGSAYHSWGDEWNVVVWYIAKDIATFVAAFNELVGRVEKRHPKLIPQLLSWCTEHKDSFLNMGKVANRAAATGTPARN